MLGMERQKISEINSKLIMISHFFPRKEVNLPDQGTSTKICGLLNLTHNPQKILHKFERLCTLRP